MKDVAGSLKLVVVYALWYCFISYLCRSRAATDAETEDLLKNKLLKVEKKHLQNKLRRALLRNAFLSIKEQCGEKSGYSYAMKAEELHATPACS